ncbi:Uncharacterised protein [Yersinia enterocolitica]|nr:hypothetical protein CH47_1946 [Yersinia enterocolitica]VTP73787.1 Uncharacterised protein [Yersinia enterocolitica subsp. enterocolitica]AJJ24933.1 hypothetical protein CH49_2023 [Yersinia enterocolitica]KGA71268.1 hypothetical protein DJ59_24 [Yersinia enterocolitica]KGA76104.1 hypothetical protein DJ60_85 [Yersinia enterocolitica]
MSGRGNIIFKCPRIVLDLQYKNEFELKIE